MACCQSHLGSDLQVFGAYFPAILSATTLITSCVKVSSLDDIKSTSQGDNNAMKTLALDHLGVIAAHLRTSTLKFKRDSNEFVLAPLDEVNPFDDHIKRMY